MTDVRRPWVLVLILASACSGAPAPGPGAGASVPPCRAGALISPGQPIPFGCRFERPDGSVLALADLKGKPSIINFWASWCANCIDEMPALERAHDRLGGRVRFIGANLLGVQGETESASTSFARKTGVTYEVIYDTGGLLYAHFSARLLPPTTILIDASGIVRYRHFGPLDADEIASLAKRHLGVA